MIVAFNFFKRISEI